ncbi:unnamed protein product [Orchesella dallaii]|uniref:Pre-mRNA-splicing factor RBM22 n=1 Tax=Orchesella dallaii TaxID=48710 RepID=A0ABP1RZF3_9HEXA
MAMSKTTNTYNRQNWEDSDFPILCETCLGDNPYVRMTKDKFGSECKICMRPFTVFRWCPGAKMRFKKTEICQTCAKLKNVCQTCLLDLEFGLPIQVRDSALKVKDNLPRNEVNKEYYIQNLESQVQGQDNANPLGEVGKAQSSSDLLMKLARTTPYYKRNRPHVCSFWVKGECKRGEECPYRHEKPTDPDDPLSDQNIRDRYYGTNDPVADKLLRRASAMPVLTPPEDKSITTLYVGNLGEFMSESDLRDHFYQFGEIRSITIVQKQQCGFVQFTSRAAAEVAAEKSFNKLIIMGRRLTVRWGKSQAKQTSISDDGSHLPPVPGLPGALPPPPPMSMGGGGGPSGSNFFNLPMSSGGGPGGGLPPYFLPPPPLPSGPAPPRASAAAASSTVTSSSAPAVEPPVPGTERPLPIYYPSQDPTRLGAVQLKNSKD